MISNPCEKFFRNLFSNSMMKYLFAFTLTIYLIAGVYAQDELFFSRADRFLKEYVKGGDVKYASLMKDHTLLDSLVSQIGEMNLASASGAYQQAFYINAYNLLVIHNVLKKYPVKSPKKIDGFFDKAEHKIAGKYATLNALEFDILFNNFKDVRFHFALNCGAVSCPTLYSQAFNPQELEDQLRFNTKMVMDRDDYVLVDHQKKTIYVSKIFEWYKNMFEAEGSSIDKFISHNRFDPLPKDYKIAFFEYDWSLNDFSE